MDAHKWFREFDSMWEELGEPTLGHHTTPGEEYDVAVFSDGRVVQIYVNQADGWEIVSDPTETQPDDWDRYLASGDFAEGPTPKADSSNDDTT